MTRGVTHQAVSHPIRSPVVRFVIHSTTLNRSILPKAGSGVAGRCARLVGTKSAARIWQDGYSRGTANIGTIHLAPFLRHYVPYPPSQGIMNLASSLKFYTLCLFLLCYLLYDTKQFKAGAGVPGGYARLVGSKSAAWNWQNGCS